MDQGKFVFSLIMGIATFRHFHCTDDFRITAPATLEGVPSNIPSSTNNFRTFFDRPRRDGTAAIAQPGFDEPFQNRATWVRLSKRMIPCVSRAPRAAKTWCEANPERSTTFCTEIGVAGI